MRRHQTEGKRQVKYLCGRPTHTDRHISPSKIGKSPLRMHNNSVYFMNVCLHIWYVSVGIQHQNRWEFRHESLTCSKKEVLHNPQSIILSANIHRLRCWLHQTHTLVLSENDITLFTSFFVNWSKNKGNIFVHARAKRRNAKITLNRFSAYMQLQLQRSIATTA